MTRARRRLGGLGAVLASVLAVVALLSVASDHPDQPAGPRVLRPVNTASVTGSQWQAGNIVSDAVFYNSATMTATTIQNFLNAQGPTSCSGTCLKSFHMATKSEPAESGLCSAYTGQPSETAAQIFANVARACGVNPQSLLVIAQKESSAITSSSPNYTTTMGYGCPDSTGCAAKYYGFFNQVYLAARQFKLYRLHPTNYGYVAGETNYILYNPKTSCGGSNVFIQNQATAGLYDYTPYQPNAAALANLHGTGDSCSTYGNRNFWVFFNNWFGNTTGLPTAPLPYDRGGLLATKTTGGSAWYYSNNATMPHPLAPAVQVLGNSLLSGSVTTGDMNADGLADMLTASTSGGLYLYTNNGTSQPFGAPVKIGAAGWQKFNRIRAVDAAGTGKDGLVVTQSNGTAGYYPNTGVATSPFGSYMALGTGWQVFSSISTGDVDSDGFVDLIAMKPDGTLWWLRSNGNASKPYGTAWARLSAPSLLGYTTIVGDDTNADGRADLVARKADGSLWLFPNSGSPATGYTAPIEIGMSGWSQFTTLNSMTAPVPHRRVSSNLISTTPAGALWSAPDLLPVKPYPATSSIGGLGWLGYSKIAMGDVTGDGRADLVAMSSNGTLWLFANDGNPTHPYSTRIGIGSVPGYTALTIGDVNGDGWGDLIGVTSTGQLRLFVNQRSTTEPFTTSTVIGLGGWSKFTNLDAVDLDGDGKVDLVVTTATGGLLVYYGVGGVTTPFPAATTLYTSGWQVYRQLVPIISATRATNSPADLLARSADGVTWLYRATGPRTKPFGAPERITANLPGMVRLVGGDVLDHGRTDLVAVTSSGTLTLSPSAGVDVLGPPGLIGTGAWQNFDRITVGDVNGDGLADLVASEPNGTLWMYLAGTTASHPYTTSVEIGLGGWQNFDRIVVGDVNGDGRADMLATRLDGTTWLYLAGTNMNAPYGVRTQVLSGLQAYDRIALGDVTRDGVDDLVATKPDGTMWLFRNHRTPNAPFAAPVQIGSGWQAYDRITLTDVNHDGIVDVLATRPDGTLWYCPGTLSSTAPFGTCVPTTTTDWTAYDRIAA